MEEPVAKKPLSSSVRRWVTISRKARYVVVSSQISKATVGYQSIQVVNILKTDTESYYVV